jgi:hypothetical protein
MSRWDQANGGEKLNLVLKNRKKISQIINDYLYLSFFLIIILCLLDTHGYRRSFGSEKKEVMDGNVIRFSWVVISAHDGWQGGWR